MRGRSRQESCAPPAVPGCRFPSVNALPQATRSHGNALEGHPRPLRCAVWSFLLIATYALKPLPGRNAGVAGLLHLDRLPRLGITRGPSSPIPLLKGAEAWQCHLVTSGDRVGHRVENAFTAASDSRLLQPVFSMMLSTSSVLFTATPTDSVAATTAAVASSGWYPLCAEPRWGSRARGTAGPLPVAAWITGNPHGRPPSPILVSTPAKRS